jgi:hypothetical protein
MIYAYDSAKKAWAIKGSVKLPQGMTKEQVLRAIGEGKIGAKPKPWRDLTINDETLDTYYGN